MSDYLCISVTMLDERYHGRGDRGEPEWPPSPLRLFQAIVAANAGYFRSETGLHEAFHWLESQAPPCIIAATAEVASPYCLSVPNNAMDLVGRAWTRGNYFGGGDANPSTHRTMKNVRPIRISDGGRLHYVWPLNGANSDAPSIQIIRAARRLVALGWGVDMAIANAKRINKNELAELVGERWSPCVSQTATHLRTAVDGTFAGLRSQHEAFLNRITSAGFAPVAPLTAFEVTGYRRPTDPIARSYAVFELRHDNGSFCRYPQQKLIHIAGMVRGIAIDQMKHYPPSDVVDAKQWVDRYVAGHARDYPGEHRQFSYLPLPTIGHVHADHAVRRVMITAPLGDDSLLEHLAMQLDKQQLKPEKGDEFGAQAPPMLDRVYRDKMARRYTGEANRWASVTPVILPGHTDRKHGKTVKLIERSLREAGIEQPCTFEWSPISHFAKSLPAHKHDRNKRPVFFKPSYLQNLTAVHLTLTFEGGSKVPGPLALGAGRHCGFGLMASIDE